jgi:hypothetical protein
MVSYEETEDVKHFLLMCPTLNDIREEHLYTLKCYLNNIQEGAYEAICENKQLMQLILDSSMDISNLAFTSAFFTSMLFLTLFSRLGASFQKVGVVSLGISKLTFLFFFYPSFICLKRQM